MLSKWGEKLNTEVNWNKTFKMIQSIPEIKLKWFQIRIIHRILPTNVVLFCMGVKTDSRCSFCHHEKDSLVHVLWRCTRVNTFWTQLQQLIRDKCSNIATFNLNENIILFGNDLHFKSDKVLDLILLLAKFYIHTCKMKDDSPQINIFKKILKARYERKIYCFYKS